MKTGAGDDPFADDFDDEGAESDEDAGESDRAGTDDEPAASEREPYADATESDRSTTGESSTDEDSRQASAGDSASSTSDDGGDDDSGPAKEDIPWVLRRSAVKEDRDNVHQFFLRDEYAEREEELRVEVADILGMRTKDVKKLDLREAMFAVVEAEDIAAELDEWGYEYLK